MEDEEGTTCSIQGTKEKFMHMFGHKTWRKVTT